jgi:quinol-cytochrome oxidoreductase complex cytochrome b subunit
VKTGVLVWIATVVVGVLLRRFAWDESSAGAFVVVAAVFNAFTLVGWRVVRENLRTRTLTTSE